MNEFTKFDKVLVTDFYKKEENGMYVGVPTAHEIYTVGIVTK